ncbi:hypothetical protein [Streptomyces sp. NPDC101393]|uniref:hypothetical protein n=1 Tax=Streptomyces sp. NPDC101393 TaxID=3366141 RepID=UPI003812222C
MGTVVCGIGLFLPFAPQVAPAQDYLPNRPGTASGLTPGPAMSAGGPASPAFGARADSRGLHVTFSVVLAVFLVPVVAAVRLPDRTPPAAPRAQRERESPVGGEGGVSTKAPG